MAGNVGIQPVNAWFDCIDGGGKLCETGTSRFGIRHGAGVMGASCGGDIVELDWFPGIV